MYQQRNRQVLVWVAISASLHTLLLSGLATIDNHEPIRVPLTLPGSVTVRIAATETGANKQVRAKRARQDYMDSDQSVVASQRDVKQDNTNDRRAGSLSRQPAGDYSGEKETSLSELQRLLLVKIDQHKQYPVNAIRLRQEGSARIGFRLRKSGHIEKLAIMRSSGYRALDQAALSAISEIQPFEPASRFIREVASLQIEIVFQL